MALRKLIVIGASAGGVPALEKVVSALPSDLDAAVFIVLHLRPESRSHLPEILQRKTSLEVAHAEDQETIRAGHVYVARPDHHLVIEKDSVRNTRGPRENRTRPSIDVLFRSAAFAHDGRAIGVILSGTHDDGTAGLWSIKDRGGTALVQDPETAEYGSMPRSAIDYVDVDQVAPLDQLGPLLVKAARRRAMKKRRGPVSKELEVEAKVALEGRALQLGLMALGSVSPYTCPECQGALVELEEGGVPRFRCHTGHAYSINSLLAEVTQYVEYNFWSGIRAVEESMMLLRHLAKHIREDKSKNPRLSRVLEEKAKDAEARADAVRQALMTHQSLTEDNVLELARSRPIKRGRLLRKPR